MTTLHSDYSRIRTLETLSCYRTDPRSYIFLDNKEVEFQRPLKKGHLIAAKVQKITFTDFCITDLNKELEKIDNNKLRIVVIKYTDFSSWSADSKEKIKPLITKSESRGVYMFNLESFGSNPLSDIVSEANKKRSEKKQIQKIH